LGVNKRGGEGSCPEQMTVNQSMKEYC
jgi:hypothetical protein